MLVEDGCLVSDRYFCFDKFKLVTIQRYTRHRLHVNHDKSSESLSEQGCECVTDDFTNYNEIQSSKPMVLMDVVLEMSNLRH